MTTEHINKLMEPRYEVTAGYPHMDRDQINVGDIVSPYGMGFVYPDKVKEMYDSFPHLFTPIHWSQKRPLTDLPEYVKTETGHVYKVKEWDGSRVPRIWVDSSIHTAFVVGCVESVIYPPYFPATVEDFNAYASKNRR